MSIAEIITACTAIAALLLAAYQLYETRKHNRILLKPCLTQHRQIVNRKTLKVTIQNVGLGPAEILSFKYEVNGNFYDDLYLAIKDSPMPIHVKSLSAFSAKPGAVIPANKEVVLYEAEFIDSAHFEEIEKAIDVNVDIKYASFFGEEFDL